ncbi:MAG: hypothetical protein JWQ27_1661 [Ferruginibacter sp.]|nr:hypothetical protein [Ferruginibacter sp.]
MIRSLAIGCCLFFIVNSSCNYISYTPKSKKAARREMPSILLLEKIVDFRIEQMGWPASQGDFISKDIKFYRAMEGFPYRQTTFKIIDSNNMIFYFTGHIKDLEKNKRTGKTELNGFGGHVKFYKENNKFIWKIKLD